MTKNNATASRNSGGCGYNNDNNVASLLVGGKSHPTLQQYTCAVRDDGESILKSRNISLNDVTTWFRQDNHVAFYDGNQQKCPMTYAMLHKQIKAFPPYKFNNNTATNNSNNTYVVGLLLPACYMSEMAVLLLSLLGQHSFTKGKICVAPIDPTMGLSKTIDTINQLNCTAIITTKELYEETVKGHNSNLNLQDVRFVEKKKNNVDEGGDDDDNDNIVGLVNWTFVKQEPLQPAAFDDIGNDEEDLLPAMLLRTSGTTSSKPKLVPITLKALLYNAVCLASSLELHSNSCDIACNAMPLFHIGGISTGLLSVVVSGTSVIMMSGPFDSYTFLHTIMLKSSPDDDRQVAKVSPTWYSAVPSMHKALVLTAQSRLQQELNATKIIPNRLRFIRSGAAHLPHTTALELAKVFNTKVVTTYSMSECMPISSSYDSPIDASNPNRRHGVDKDTVGIPTGCDVAILDETGNILPYGNSSSSTNNDNAVGSSRIVGEIAIKGPGVMKKYIGISKDVSHVNNDGDWFKTGDIGWLDRNNGYLTLSGRKKEMIKRGGDQIWPTEIDDIIEKHIHEVETAVSFGVPNELWGEEVQVAIVLKQQGDANKEEIIAQIKSTCTTKLGVASTPTQIIFVDSTQDLLKGPTGKYIRTKMALHLNVQAVDIGALNILQAMTTTTKTITTTSATSSSLSSSSAPKAKSVTKKKTLVKPSTALNGVRVIASCFVVLHHIGLMPTLALLKIQSYGLNMTIFMLLGAFQLTTSLRSSVVENNNTAQFIGTKIGSMHALFFVSHIIAIGSMLLFKCGTNGYLSKFENTTCSNIEESGMIGYLFFAILQAITGMVPFSLDLTNIPSWFQSAFYALLIMFPYIDHHLRSSSWEYKHKCFWFILGLATFGPICIFYGYTFRIDSPYLLASVFNFFFISWIPAFVSAMIAGYYFTEYAQLDDNDDIDDGDAGDDGNADGNANETDNSEDQQKKNNEKLTKSLFQRPKVWGIITDILSVLFFIIEVLVATSPTCISLTLDQYHEARPGIEPLEEDIYQFSTNSWVQHFGGYNTTTYVEVCDNTSSDDHITYDEFIDYVQSDPMNEVHVGRVLTMIGEFIGFNRMGTPLVLCWLFGLSYGKGFTAKVMKNSVLQYLSTYAYSIYLLHIPITRYYWVVTRGHDAQFWWLNSRPNPLPIYIWEIPIVIAICLVLAAFLDKYIIQWLSQYTIRFGVAICKCIFCCSLCNPTSDDRSDDDANNDGDGGGMNDNDTTVSPTIIILRQVQNLIRGLTGNSDVDVSTSLRDIGLDSLGATALLGTLRATIPNARIVGLSLSKLSACETVGDLVTILDVDVQKKNEEEEV